MRNLFFVGDYLFLSYQDNSVYALAKTNDASSYQTATWKSTINPEMPDVDRTRKKRLVAVSLSTEPLPSTAQIVLKYKVDGGNFTTIFTETTDGNITSEKRNAFTAGREYEFMIESSNGAEPTELKYEYDIVTTQI